MSKEEKADEVMADVPPPAQNSKKEKKDAAKEEEELSEEDQKLKEELDMLVERLTESNTELYPAALETLRDLIRTSTSSMTAVPKPLKFLKPHYPRLTEVYEQWPDSNASKIQLADMLSVLAMTSADESSKTGKSLYYRLRCNVDNDDFGLWGHEYMRHLALEIGDEFRARQEVEKPTGDLLDLALRIAPFFLKHNAEADAVDMLIEVESVERLIDFVDPQTYARACRYLLGCAAYLDRDYGCFETAYRIYKQYGELSTALSTVLSCHMEFDEGSDNPDYFTELIEAAGDDVPLKQQLAFILARQRRFPRVSYEEQDEEIASCISNSRASEYFRFLAKELNLEKPKVPQDVYKNSYDSVPLGLVVSDHTKLNLASIFVRGFLNAGYSNDPILNDDAAAASWIHRSSRGPVNAACATTTLGLMHLWNYHDALQELDKHIYASEDYVKAGALIGIGVGTCGVHDETDAAIGLLSEHVESGSTTALRTSAMLGLAFAYAGTARSDLAELLEPLAADASYSMEIASVATLALGVIFVGSNDGQVTAAIMTSMLERSSADLNSPMAIFMALGFALLYCNKPEELDTAMTAANAIEHPIAKVLEVLLVMCAYCGTGDVLQIQYLLKKCTTLPYEDEEEDEGDEDLAETSEAVAETAPGAPEAAIPDASMEHEDHEDHESHNGDDSMETENQNQSSTSADQKDEKEDRLESVKLKGLCTLGIGIIGMGEEIGQEMVLRHFEHLMQYGDSYIKQAVPLAMGLVSASNPQMKIYETLSRYTHDPDLDVATNAIFSMGLVSAGTVNARVAQLLGQLDAYYARESDALFMVRFAQGLLNLGKGTMSLNPFNTDRQVLSPVSFAGLLIVSVTMLSPPKNFVLLQHPELLFFLTLAIQPRSLITVDENLEPLKVSVRVGQAVDVVGQAGRPKTITGWVTQDTPVLLSYGERAELENDDYIPLSSNLEGVVILRKNPEKNEES